MPKLAPRTILLLGGAAILLLVAGLLLSRLPGRDQPPPPATPAPTVAGGATATPVAGFVVETPAPGDCPAPPANWQPYLIQSGETLQGLAARAGVSTVRILRVNCLDDETLVAGNNIYLPPLAAATACRPRRDDWILTTVEIDDTLTGLASARGVTVQAVMQGNCLVDDAINAGDQLYLPPLPTPTPIPVAPTETPVVVAGPTQPPPTSTATDQSGQTQPQPSSQQQASASSPDAGPAASVGGGQGQAIAVINPFAMAGISRVDLSGPSHNSAAELADPCRGVFTATVETGFDPTGQPPVTELGQRQIFFVCYFKPQTATVTGPAGFKKAAQIFAAERVARYKPEIVKPDELTATISANVFISVTTAIVDWPALPLYLTGTYTVTVLGQTQAISAPFLPAPIPAKPVTQSLTFTLKAPTTITPTILPLPLFGEQGRNFAVYYSNFELGAAPRFTLMFDKQGDRVSEIHASRTTWPVSIDQPLGERGWGFTLISSKNATVTGTYIISQAHPVNGVTAELYLTEPETDQ